MTKKVRFPLRFKLLIAQLLVVTVALSVITFTMANRFHDDKTAYIHDLTSTVVLHTADEATALVSGYRDRLNLFSRVLARPRSQERTLTLQGLFEEFGDFLLVTREAGGTTESVYDEASLAAAGVHKEELERFRTLHPLPELKAGEPLVENSTVSAKLPTLTVTIREPDGTVGSAVITLERLQRLAQRSRVFDTFLVDQSGRFLAHTDPARVGSAADASWWDRGRRVSARGMTLEYQVQGKGIVGGFARTGCGGLTAVVQIPKSAAYLTSRALLGDLLQVTLALLAGAALLSLFWSRRLTRPIEELSGAARLVGQGKFEIKVQDRSGDELGVMADSFNRMASELKSRETALKELYGQLVQSEKMAAFGALGAGIAHEVKNPLAGILGITQLSLRGLQSGHPMEKNLLVIEKETKRCKTIIENLLRFARQEQVEFSEVRISQVVSDAIAIVSHQLGINSIKVEKALDPELPACQGNANQLQQVLMNLMINAQQAMAGNAGTVRLTARPLPGQVELRVCDTGPGIKKEIQARIFDPFFTTKPAGQGTGLGLSVSYGIVKEHGGEIRLESREGEGSTFIITLPAVEELAQAR